MTNYYVAKSGNNSTGRDWAHAWNELNQIGGRHFPEAIRFGWLEEHIPLSWLQQNQEHPGAQIYVKRVLGSDAVPVSAVGWSSSFDSQIIINPSTSTNAGILWGSGTDGVGSYVTIDGRLDTGTSCGIRSNVANGNVGGALKFDTGCTGVVVNYVDAAGPAGTGSFTYSSNACALYCYYNVGRGNIINPTFNYCRFHGAVNAVLLGVHLGATFYECKFYDVSVQNSGTYHGNLCYMGQSTTPVTFIGCNFTNWDSEGILMKSLPQTAICINCIWHDQATVSTGRAIQTKDTTHTVLMYNNTIVNCTYGLLSDVASSGSFGTGSQQRNNIYYQLTSNGDGYITDSDYTFTNAGSATGSNSVVNGSNPFVNNTGQNYVLIGTIGSTYPVQKGINLSNQFQYDAAGLLRKLASNQNWDIGAFEYPESAPTTPASVV
jgi:hypothetical protein